MTPKADPTRIIEITSAFYDSCVLFTASDLGIFEALDTMGPSSAEALAGKLSLNDRATSPSSERLCRRRTHRKSQRPLPQHPGDNRLPGSGIGIRYLPAIRYNRDVYRPWGHLGEFVRGGTPVESEELHLGADPERTRTFVLSMHHRTLAIGRSVVSRLR